MKSFILATTFLAVSFFLAPQIVESQSIKKKGNAKTTVCEYSKGQNKMNSKRINRSQNCVGQKNQGMSKGNKNAVCSSKRQKKNRNEGTGNSRFMRNK